MARLDEAQRARAMTVPHERLRYVLPGLMCFLLVCMTVPTACTTDKTQPTPTPISPPPVPARADLIAEIEIARILNDGDFANLYEEMVSRDMVLPQTWDGALDKIEDKTGIDPRDCTSAIVFADSPTLVEIMSSSQGDSLPYYGALVKGNLDEGSFLRKNKGKMGQKFEINTYENYKVYTCTGSASKEEAFSIVFPGNGEMIAGSANAVADVIDVMTGAAEPISGNVYDMYSQLGHGLIKVASRVPQSLTRRIPPELSVGSIKMDLYSLRDIDYGTLTLSKKETTATANTRLEFSNKDSAKDSERLLKAYAMFARYTEPNPEVMELLDKVQLTTSDSSVSITCSTTLSQMGHLILAPPLPFDLGAIQRSIIALLQRAGW